MERRTRIIRSNDPEFNATFKYALIPVVSSLSPFTTILPLGMVLSLTAIKDAVDDIQRCRTDNEVNKRPVMVLRGSSLHEVAWDKVQVGDIIYLSNDDFVTADLLIISTSEASGLCYIETAELDGETNLKVKQAKEETAVLKDRLDALSHFKGNVKCEPPNNRLDRFEGQVEIDGRIIPINNDSILLRGCRMRNTNWCFGMVVYAGIDTKLMQNSGRPKLKRTMIDKMLNIIIIRIVIVFVAACFVISIGTMIFEGVQGYNFSVYAPWETFAMNSKRVGGAIVIGLLNTLSYIILLNTVVPISLYVSIEIIRLFQSKMVDWDLQMYYAEDDIAARARTTTLNEELGKVQYIFSDKTGTLTRNVMTFNCCSINGIKYGLIEDDGTMNEVVANQVQLPNHCFLDPEFRWYDKKLLEMLERRDPMVVEFMTNLALCHTVMSELKQGVLKYQAQSPDENALVAAARNFGIVFKGRTSNSISLSVFDKPMVYDVLNILDFNNERKRMSIIVKPRGTDAENMIYLYCKGADAKIKPLLSSSSLSLWHKTEEHMNRFGSNGLRTLCLARRVIDSREYDAWNKEFAEASISLDNREEKLNDVYNKIETDLQLLGATAIEDKLQDGVPETIRNLIRADIRIWVLTGDKLETAINIGLSCRLLSEAMDLFTLEEETVDGVREKLASIKENMIAKVQQMYAYYDPISWDWLELCSKLGDRIDTPADGYFDGFALAVSGQSLLHAVGPECEKEFVDVACFCKAVICCRVTPLQKADVVKLVKKHKKAITLAIGDGANDVSMIQRAHIGVGISGKEGRQAVLASDYSFAQFKYLQNLLLVHGRWSYMRVCKFLTYFFYKNFAFTCCNFWYAFFCGMSAQTAFDPFYIATYNVFFTSMPVFALGILDQDINAKNSMRSPHLYKFGQSDKFFNWKTFMISIVHGMVTSFAIFFISYLSFNGTTLPSGIDEADLQSFGCVLSFILTIIVNLQIGLDTYYWTGINHFFIWGTIVVCFLFHFTLYSTTLWAWFKVGYYYVGVAQVVLSSWRFWLTCMLTVIVCLVPVFSMRCYMTSFYPSKIDEVRFKQRYGIIPKQKDSKMRKKISDGRKWFRSGYAFSHSEGFGNLIKAGVMVKKVFEVLDLKNDTSTTSSSTNIFLTEDGRNRRNSRKEVETTLIPDIPNMDNTFEV